MNKKVELTLDEIFDVVTKETAEEKKVRLNKERIDLLNRKAVGYFCERQYDLAEVTLNKMRDIGLNDIRYYSDMTALKISSGDYNAAIILGKKSINALKNDFFLKKNISPIYAEISYAYYKIGNKKQAKYNIRRAVEVRLSKDFDVNIINALFELKMYDEAIKIGLQVKDNDLAKVDFVMRIACKEMGDDVALIRHMGRMQNYNDGKALSRSAIHKNRQVSRPKITVNGLTVDLKQMADGSVRILELNALPMSGLKGFNPHHKIAMEDRINYDYRRLVEQLDNDGYYDRSSNNYIEHKFLGLGSETFTDNFYFQEFNNVPVLFNASLNALTASMYKDDFILNVQRLGLSDFIPNSVVASRYASLDDVMRDAEKLNGDHFIIKTSNDARSEGVEIIPANRLQDVVSNILNGGAWHGCNNKKTWKNDYRPNFVIQECVQSKPCVASDGEKYDATMRVVLTNVFNHETNKGRVIFHGMFWKLPRDPILEKKNRCNVISLANNEDIRSGKPFSARVAPSRQVQVKEHLSEFFNVFGDYMSWKNSWCAQFAQKNAELNDNSPESLLATEILSSHPYGPLFDDIRRNDGIKDRFNLMALLNDHEHFISNCKFLPRGDQTVKTASALCSRSGGNYYIR